MKASLVFVGVALFGISALGVRALSQQSEQASQPAGCCPMCMNMMKGGQMGPEMMRRMQTVMRMPIFLDSPAAINAQAEKLGLSEEQTKKLDEIGKEARRKAVEVLNPEQRAKLGESSGKPFVMIEMCQQMMPKAMGGPMKGRMMCPMMMGAPPAGQAETEQGQQK